MIDQLLDEACRLGWDGTGGSLPWLVAEVERLREIVDRLPRDGDGNPMTGCEDVWVLRPSDGEIYQARTYGPYPPAAAEWAPVWGDLHGSRDAAEKARGK